MTDAATVIAKSLKSQLVERCYGIVGFPVIELGQALQEQGIFYIGCRNEQSASYAAAAEGFLTQRPGISLAVSGPGVIHAFAGCVNAKENGWPMILLGGACSTVGEGMGDFQEFPQIEASRPYVKWAIRPPNMESIPRIIEQAVRISTQGRPGAVYIDLPSNLLQSYGPEPPYPVQLQGPSCPQAQFGCITAAVELLRTAERPLVITGKGALYSRAENEARQFIKQTELPFLPSPMGKGLISDKSPFSVSAARSTALRRADVILLVGARLNWIMHFGMPPRFAPDVKIIQIDICPEQLGTNIPAAVPLHGDCKAILSQLVDATRNWKFTGPWWEELRAKCEANRQGTLAQLAEPTEPLMNYYHAITAVHETIPEDAIIIGEGANTMDIGRTILQTVHPRHRLDAGSFGTMGVGLGQMIAAKACNPEKTVVGVVGDSAFGFSCMELETAVRYNLPMVVVIINNNGIFSGVDALAENPRDTPVIGLSPGARYEMIADAFGGKGYAARTPAEVKASVSDALASKKVCVINVAIQTTSVRKQQEFTWKTEPNSKL